MELWNAFANPADITYFARNLPDNNVDNLAQILPDRTIQGIKTRQVRRTTTRVAARYRAWNAETPIGQRPDTITVTEVSLPPIGEKLPLTEFDLLMLATAGQVTPGMSSQVLEAIYDDAERIVNSIRNRVALARGDFLNDGKFTLTAENGLTMEYDAALAGTHAPTAGTLWSTVATATPITNEKAWIKVITDDGGDPPAYALTSSAVLTLLCQNVEYKAYQYPLVTSPPTLTPAQVNQVRAANSLPPLLINDYSVSVDGSTTRLIPANKFILAAGNVGETQWGVTADALELVGSNAVDMTFADAPGLFGAAWKSNDPATKWTKVTGTVMPVAGDINGLVSATVTA